MSVFVPTCAGVSSLKQLACVDWSQFAHAYSPNKPAHHVRAILEDFAADDVEARIDAYQGIISTVWHQGTIYPATAPTIPFLAALAAETQTPNRGLCLASLVLIAYSVARGDATEPHVASARAAFVASRSWLEAAETLGPEVARSGVSWIRAALFSAEKRDEIPDVVGELEAWGWEGYG